MNCHVESLVKKAWADDEADFVRQHPILQTTRSHTLKNKNFTKWERGTLLVVTFSVSNKRRTIISILELPKGMDWDAYTYSKRSTYQRRLEQAIKFSAVQYGADSWQTLNSQIEVENFGKLCAKLAAGGVEPIVPEPAPSPWTEPTHVPTSDDSIDEFMRKVHDDLSDDDLDLEPDAEPVEFENELLMADDGTYVLDAANNGYWIDTNVFVTSDTFDLFAVSKKMIEKAPKNLMMIGPSGYGKTTVPQAFAETWGMRYFRMNCASIRDPEEWFGYREARDGETVFIYSPFAKAVIEGNVVIVLDEFNRVEPWLHNTLYPLLDHDRKTVVHGDEIKCGPNVLFVATVNLGYQFVGTFSLDSAITNRMDAVILVNALPPAVEETILESRTGIDSTRSHKIITIINKLRDIAKNDPFSIDISTRSSLKVADFVAAGLKMDASFKAVLINAAQEDEAKRIIDTIQNNLH